MLRSFLETRENPVPQLFQLLGAAGTPELLAPPSVFKASDTGADPSHTAFAFSVFSVSCLPQPSEGSFVIILGPLDSPG